jgi:hypothetical protein
MRLLVVALLCEVLFAKLLGRCLLFKLFPLPALVVVPNASAMSYHDNYVDFPTFFGTAWTLNSAQFIVEDLSITSGQDPNPRNRVGDVKELIGGRSFMFSVGRKGSKTVANW